jgi:hypothetical protein
MQGRMTLKWNLQIKKIGIRAKLNTFKSQKMIYGDTLDYTQFFEGQNIYSLFRKFVRYKNCLSYEVKGKVVTLLRYIIS